MNLAVDDECRVVFQDLKFRRKQIRYIIYRLDKQKIVVQKIGAKEEKWADFVEALPETQYRFGVFDYEFTHADNRHVSKLIFINWNPQASPLKGRVLYATAKQNFKKYLDMNSRDYILTSKDEKIQEEIIKELSK